MLRSKEENIYIVNNFLVKLLFFAIKGITFAKEYNKSTIWI